MAEQILNEKRKAHCSPLPVNRSPLTVNRSPLIAHPLTTPSSPFRGTEGAFTLPIRHRLRRLQTKYSLHAKLPDFRVPI